MSYRRLLVLYALIFILVAAQTMSFGEESHSGGEPSSSVERPVADSTVSKTIIEKMVKLFPMFTETTFSDRYASRLAKAISDYKRGDEAEIADIIAELFGTINDAQLENIFKEIGENPDLPLLKRIKEAGLSVKKKSGDPELAKFHAAFEEKFKKVREKNQDFYKLLNEALTNDAAKRKLMAEGYDPELLLSWWREQCATGNQKLCDDLGNGVTFKDGQTGDRFLDTFNADGKKGRLVIPSGQAVSDALQDLSDQTGSFRKLKLTPTQHETLDETPVRARPRATARPTAPPRTGETGSAPPRQQPAPPAKPQVPTSAPKPAAAPVQPPVTPSGDAQLKAKDAAAGAALIAKCFECHGPTLAKPKGGFKFNTVGGFEDTRVSAASPDWIDRVIDRVLNDKDSPMPPSGKTQLNEAEKQAIRDWGKAHGVNAQSGQ